MHFKAVSVSGQVVFGSLSCCKYLWMMSVWYDIPAQAPGTHSLERISHPLLSFIDLKISQTISWFSWLGCLVANAAGIEVLWLRSLLNLRRSARLDPAKLVWMTLFGWDPPGWRTGWWADEWAMWKDVKGYCPDKAFLPFIEVATSAWSKRWEPGEDFPASFF